MNLPKAIEICELNIKEAGSKMPPDTLEALKLATASMKRILLARSYNDQHTLNRLPGEA